METRRPIFTTKSLPLGVRVRVGGLIYRTSIGRLGFWVREALRDTGWIRSWRLGRPVTREGKPLPWYTYSAIHFLEGRVKPSMRVFEYGSGHSTLWYAERVSRVISVEHHEAWAREMSTLAPPNAQVIFRADPNEYVKEILDHDMTFDIIVIDGVERPASVEVALQRLAPDGVIVWDNSDHPEFLEARSSIPELGKFRELLFQGFGPIAVRNWATSILYRPENCLGI